MFCAEIQSSVPITRYELCPQERNLFNHCLQWRMTTCYRLAFYQLPFLNISKKNLSCAKAHTRKEFSTSHFNQAAYLRLISSYVKPSFRYKTCSHSMLYTYSIAQPRTAWRRQILLWHGCRCIFQENIPVSTLATHSSLSK